MILNGRDQILPSSLTFVHDLRFFFSFFFSVKQAYNNIIATQTSNFRGTYEYVFEIHTTSRLNVYVLKFAQSCFCANTVVAQIVWSCTGGRRALRALKGIGNCRFLRSFCIDHFKCTSIFTMESVWVINNRWCVCMTSRNTIFINEMDVPGIRKW